MIRGALVAGHRIRSWWQSAAKWLALVAVIWLSQAKIGWAQAQTPAPETEGKSYVVSYMIIIIFVGAALVMICRSGKRTVSFRRD